MMRTPTDRPSRHLRPGFAPGEDPRPTGVGTLAMVALVPLSLLALSSPWLLVGGVACLLCLHAGGRRFRARVGELRAQGRTGLSLPFGVRVELVAGQGNSPAQSTNRTS